MICSITCFGNNIFLRILCKMNLNLMIFWKPFDIFRRNILCLILIKFSIEI